MGRKGAKRIGSIAWHKEQIKKKEEAKKDYKPSRVAEPKKIPASNKNAIKYDFLKYIRIVFKWGVYETGLSRPHIELLLYLYSCGNFSKKQFHDFHKTLGMYEQKTFDYLTKEGWVTLLRPAVKSQKIHALYTVTTKGRRFCARVHRICCGEEEIPNSIGTSKLSGDSGKRIDNYYLDMIKKMSRDKKDSN